MGKCGPLVLLLAFHGNIIKVGMGCVRDLYGFLRGFQEKRVDGELLFGNFDFL